MADLLCSRVLVLVLPAQSTVCRRPTPAPPRGRTGGTVCRTTPA
jgi:hypothetical protein